MEASVSPVPSQTAAQENARGMKGWLKFLGIVSIIGGGLQALSIVGILFAWLPIWLGVLLVQAGTQAQKYAEQGDTAALNSLTGRLRTYFTVSGVVTIVVLGLAVLSCILAVGAMALGLLSLPRLSDYLRQYR
ncbi:MAG: DUF5362 domain-containing protein [candidate division WOR-3 bacterium]